PLSIVDIMNFTNYFSVLSPKLRKASGQYISEVFYLELQEKFKEKGLENVTFSLAETQNSD
ncbi:hypothetical protein, partial [Epilithonimonas vandammei]|uniref:hypothetical protein n=1 Tax=Epilithonimonas vandammei TaxID=2487072 RepID=UPI0028965CC6